MRPPPTATPTVRRVAFDFPADLNPVWHPSEPEWAAMVNGTSLTMPYLEPFLIRTMREAAAPVTDPDLRAAADAFMGQEGQHFRAHRRFNDLLKASRERDPRWVQQWPRLHDPDDARVPLIDTHHPDMPVPFPAAAAGASS